MGRNKLRGYITLVVLWLVVSVVAFAVPFSKSAVFWLAYGFAVIAIVYQIYVFQIAFSEEGDVKSKFYAFPIARVGVIYLAVQLVISFIEMTFAAFLPIWLAVVVNIFPLSMAIIGCIAADVVRDEIARQDIRLKKDVSNMRELQSMSAALVGRCSSGDLKDIIQRMADEFKFSDPVSSEQTNNLEKEIRNQMNEIQKAIVDDDPESVKMLSNEILGNLAERNRICALNK